MFKQVDSQDELSSVGDSVGAAHFGPRVLSFRSSILRLSSRRNRLSASKIVFHALARYSFAGKAAVPSNHIFLSRSEVVKLCIGLSIEK